VSAIKVDGKRAYARVRDGEDVDLPSRRVTVHTLDVTRLDLPDLEFDELVKSLRALLADQL
jgi:tRNA pseudouridine55 synthase